MKFLTGTILVSTFVLAEAGCAQKPADVPQPPPPPSKTVATACKPDGTNPRPGVTVAVEVAYDEAHNTAKVVDATDPNKPIYVCEQDKVLWTADHDGEFSEPKFTGPSPFDKPFKHSKRQLKSDTLKKGSAKQHYDYEIFFTYAAKPPAKVDPRIEVMD